MAMSRTAETRLFRQEISFPYPSFANVEALISLTKPIFTLRKKTTLVNQDESFKGLYIVNCGMLKQSYLRKYDKELLTHFFLPGDIIGLDAIGYGRYTGTVTAIETSGLHLLPFRHIDDLPNTQASLKELMYCLSKAMHYEHIRLWQILKQPSDVKVAFFFITMSYKFGNQGYSPHSFRLPMSREEIANYLCMASETACRTIKRFQSQDLLSARGHEYCILDPKRLTTLAEQWK